MDADIYILANDRKAENVIETMDKYLPERAYQLGYEKERFEYWDDLKDAENQPSTFFGTELELFKFLENQSGIQFRPNFRSTIQSDYRSITLYYFQDDSLVIGINIYQDEVKEEQLLTELKEFLNSKYGYIAYHIPPEDGKIAFIKQCEILKK